MKENTQEKNLTEKREKGLFSNIKNFFRNLFSKKQVQDIGKQEPIINEQTSSFKESVRTIENEETQLLDLQERYRRGEVTENDLTDEQIEALCDLYDRQIEELKRTIKIKEEKIEQHRRKKQNEIKNNNA